jgi:siroheme decarboxylase
VPLDGPDLYHRRAGLTANGMGVRRVTEERILELGPRMAYSVFTTAHGRSTQECDAILDSIAEDTGIEERRTLHSSTEFKKIRLRYFTDEHKRREAEHA